MKGKIFLVSFLLVLSFGGLLAIFWYQESQYLLPTPVPNDYHAVNTGQAVELISLPGMIPGKPILLHFFNPDCPCSRFNMEHVRRLISQYQDQLQVYAVIHTEDEDITTAASSFQDHYDLPVPVIVDRDHTLANACGVYSTPQAALIDTKGKLYYRGNYNRSRYCTAANSNFAQMAIDSLLARKPSPVFMELATRSYGCELPAKLVLQK
ncbi:redoxin domain-containing protein [Rhodocytophaga aerolata]|uniref:Redoxin domain-containing protein n=1 Tax=Rhodocytophaga aerolata TaxID=455078 RepID=A0ABT8RE28_9BACT|nr:redoxin domain-containing protein [Rhodocytophaga aerolata]MDO1450365.1 redoxin domain-containing protein [Rhodocytophaga aerolata]